MPARSIWNITAWAARLGPLRRSAFLERVLRPAAESGPVKLTQDRLYILPTRHGLLFALLLLAMLLGAINYANSMAFVLTFLLAGLGMVSILHTYRNLAGLSIAAGKCTPVFAAQEARFALSVDNPSPFPRTAIGLSVEKRDCGIRDLAANRICDLEFTRRAERRGLLGGGRFTLYSTFPLGLFRAWTHLNLDMACLVYPRPAARALPLPAGIEGSGAGAATASGSEDFSGLRAYHAGDSLRHVAWKALARGQDMLTKQFQGEAEEERWLDWEFLPGLDDETRLSHLCRWVLDAHAAGRVYGLRLPGTIVPPAGGAEQRRRCLEALALFGPGG